jgi:putative SOS response-associated peptidase YedK
MCGRFLNRIPAAETARIFGTTNPVPNYPARYNVAPTQDVLAVRFNPKTHERSLDVLRWGLVSHSSGPRGRLSAQTALHRGGSPPPQFSWAVSLRESARPRGLAA